MMAEVAMPVAEAEAVAPVAMAMKVATPAPAAEMAMSAQPEPMEAMGFLNVGPRGVEARITNACYCSGLACRRCDCERTDSKDGRSGD